MIKSIRLQNFFGFQDCTINLEKGKNVLVGINGSGKSNFFKAIHFLIEGLNGKGLKELIFAEWGGFESICFLGDKNHANTRIVLFYEITLNEQDSIITGCDALEYEIEIIPHADLRDYVVRERIEGIKQVERQLLYHNGIFSLEAFSDSGEKFKTKNDNSQELQFARFTQQLYPLSILRLGIQSWTLYNTFDTSAAGPLRRANIPTIEKRLLADGKNLPQLLNTLKIENKDAFNKIVDALRAVNGKYSNIDFQYIASYIYILLEEKGFNKSVRPSNISDGTLRFLCLMAIFYNPNRGAVICIDEPELGLHPDMLFTLSEAIKYAAETSQVIISTHSPLLLDSFELENIIVFEKNEKNATEVKKYSEKDFEGWYDKFLPGEMWMSGDIGGNRW